MAKARDGGYATSGSEEVSSDSEARWVSWFCGLKGNEFFCEVRCSAVPCFGSLFLECSFLTVLLPCISQVDEDFIQDDFNLCSLATQVTYYNYALGT